MPSAQQVDEQAAAIPNAYRAVFAVADAIASHRRMGTCPG
jgi:hypothetical protein